MTDSFNDLVNRRPNQNIGHFSQKTGFDYLLQREEDEREKQIKQMLKLISDKDPDRVGEAQKLAADLNLPASVALDSDDAVQRLAQLNKQKQIDEVRFAGVNPILERQMLDKNFAAIAHDNVEELGLIEGTFTGIKNLPDNLAQGFEKGRLMDELGRLGFRQQLGRIGGTEEGQKVVERVNEINKRIQELDSDGSGMWENTSEFVGQWSKTMPKAIGFGTATGATWAVVGGAVGGPFAPATAKGGFVSGFMAGFVGSMSVDGFIVESGHAYQEMISSGVSHEVARNVGFGVGAVNAALEVVGTGFAVAPFKKLLVREVTKKVSKQLLKPTFQRVLVETSKDAFTSWAGEVGTEVLQELSNIAGNDIAKSFEKGEFESLIQTEQGRSEIANRLVQIIQKVGTGMIPLAGLGGASTFIGNYGRITKAEKEQTFLKDLMNLSSTNKTRIRNPNFFQTYMQKVANGNDVPNVFVDNEKFNQAMKDTGVTMEQLELFAPDLADSVKELNGAGGQGDVEIETGFLASKLGGTDLGDALQPHIRVKYDSFSAQEAFEFSQNRTDFTQQALDVMVEEDKKGQAFREEAEQVRKDMVRQISGLNLRFSKQTINNYAAFYRDFIVTQANALGMSPLEFAEKNGLKVVTQQQATTRSLSRLFNQNGTAKTTSSAFKKFFGKSVLKNKDGTPQVLMHGTADSIDGFNLNYSHKRDSGWGGSGVYLIDNEVIANINQSRKEQKKINGQLVNDGKGKNMMRLFARLENPYFATHDDKQALMNNSKEASNAFKEKLINEGYDGIIYKQKGFNEYIIFDNDAVRSESNSALWENEIEQALTEQALEEEVFNQKQQQKQGKPIPDFLVGIAKLANSFKFAGQKQYQTNRDFKVALQDRLKSEAKKASVDLSEFTVEGEKYLVKTLLEDAKFALETNPNAVGWYNEKVTKALAVLSKIHPEIATDPQAKFAFTWALANTSNGLKVDKNFELAQQAYSYYSENGVMPTDIGIGDASAAINNNMKLFNRLIEEKGFEDFEQFMKTMHTVKEVEAYTGSTVSGENKTELVYGAAVMGPKIGNGFFANLYGNFEQLTMDRWLMRTWGRMTGTLITDYTKQAKTKRTQLKALIKGLSLKDKKALEAIIGIKVKLSNLDEVAVAIQKASMKPANRKAMAKIATIENVNNANYITEILGDPKRNIERIGIGDEIRKGGNGLAKFLDGQKESPSGPVERRNIRKVFNQALTILQQSEKSLTMADLQALVWYPEKRLYDSAKLSEQEQNTGYADNEAPDYSNAAVDLALKLGVPDAEIQTTLQEVDNELKRQATIGTGGSELGEGAGGTIQRDNIETDEATGLPLNPDGTVTVYHHTNKRAAESIRESSELRSSGEPDVYVTTRNIPDTGYGDTSVAIRVDPARLSLDDEFPNGRRDFRLSVGKPRGTIRVDVGEYYEDFKKQSEVFSQQQIPTEGNRGQFDPKKLTAILGQDADLSTFLHESAHYMLTVMENIVLSGQGTQQINDDFNVLLDFFGVKDVNEWSKLTTNKKRKYHEAFAYNYELYLFEGKSPSTKLAELFHRFSGYIRAVYKTVSGDLNDAYRKENGRDLPILTDEVRGVMDRLLASKEQITEAQAVYEMKPMFETQESSGMNDADWAEYTKAIRAAVEAAVMSNDQANLRQMKWLDNAKRGVLKDLQRKEDKTRKKVKEEETVKAENLPIYKLIKFLKTGEVINAKGEKIILEDGFKISIPDLQEILPVNLKSEKNIYMSYKKKLRYMTSEDGMSVSMIAEMFGFEDPLGMINEIVEVQPIKDYINDKTEQRMLEEYSDLMDERIKELRVQEALHNEARARFISTELRYLSKSGQPVRFQVQAAKQVAREILGDKVLAQIRPTVFARNEARAAKKVMEALKKGDLEAAIEAKRGQLIQNQLAKEAVEVHKRFDKFEDLASDIFNSGTDEKIAKYRNINKVNAAKAILAHYGYGPQVENPRKYVKTLEDNDKSTYDQISPLIDDLTDLSSADVKELTGYEFDTLFEQIKGLYSQSRREKQVLIDGKKMEVDAVGQELAGLMEDMPSGVGADIGKKGPETRKEKAILFLQGLRSVLRRVEHWADGMDGAVKGAAKKAVGTVINRKDGQAGQFTRYIWRPVREALDEFRPLRNKYTKRYSEMVSDLEAKGRLPKAAISAPELGYTFGNGGTVSGKAQLLGAMLHTGNASNYRKLLLGREGWGSINEDGTLNDTRWKKFIERMEAEGYLNKQDYDFIQGVFDMNNEIKPLIQEAHFDLYGYYFKEIEPTPMITQFGEYRGGYFPAKGDPVMTKAIETRVELQDLDKEFRNSLPTTGNKFTISRTEKNRPLSIDLRVMTKHIDDTLRYATVQPAIRDVYKIIKQKDFEREMNRIDDETLKTVLIPWLHRAATQQTTISGMRPGMDKFWTGVRKRTGIGIMFANITNAMQQFTGYFPALLKVEAKYLASGFSQYLKNPMAVQNEIASLSTFMAERQSNQIFDIQDTLNDLLINPNQFQKLEAWTRKHGYFIQQAFQNQVDSVVWIGAYEKALTELPVDMSDVEARKEAIRQSDAAVRLTQDSLNPEDLATYQVGTPFYKSMVQFTGYFNMLANLNATNYKKIFRDLGWKSNKGQLAYTFLFGYIMPAVVSEMIVKALAGDLEDDDGDGYLDDVAGWFFSSTLRAGASFTPIGAPAIAVINSFNNKPYDDRITTSPSISFLEAATVGNVRTLVNLIDPNKDLTGKNIRDVLTSLSLLTNMPFTVLGRPLGYIIDVERGKIDPKDSIDALRGVVTGKASQRSRN